MKPEYLKNGIPITDDPYGDMAKNLSMGKGELIDYLNKMVENGDIIKFRALVDHKKFGFKVNALFAMKIEKIDEGKILALGNISHFYIREPVENFPYNYYAMAHFRNEDDLMKFSKELDRMGIRHEILRTLKNLKRGKK